MEETERADAGAVAADWLGMHRAHYEERLREIAETFESHARHLRAGVAAVQARTAAVDRLIQAAWEENQPQAASPGGGISLVAVGGYGRRELFPYSDVDLMFLLDGKVPERAVKEPIRRLNQMLWDAGLRVSAMTRTLAECERFDAENVEFTLALLDARAVAGDPGPAARLIEKNLPTLLTRDAKRIAERLLEVTRVRHQRYGDTLFHLEPNVKEYPGGLRDAHVCQWIERLRSAGDIAGGTPDFDVTEFGQAREFLLLVRTFLHLRHGRDNNTLDWQAQDDAAGASLGILRQGDHPGGVDAAYWMRLYFRHARAIDRGVAQYLDEPAVKPFRLRSLLPQGGAMNPPEQGFELRQNRVWFSEGWLEPAQDPDIVLAAFAAVATTGALLSKEAERRIEQALPFLSAHLEDGPRLWRRLQAILLGSFAGTALRAMHAVGMLELVIPEFHGIDALVIRDAYHRYTVDEHTFVLIDTLHGLGEKLVSGHGAPGPTVWQGRFAQVYRDLPHPELLLLAALLHDTGKGHAATGHAEESARMARNVMARLELDGYEAGLVLEVIRRHLEMSATLRRDVFDMETIRSFASGVANPEILRMLTLFTFADVSAVHPDALTPWKAENLWRLYSATAAFLDRSVDEERVAATANNELLLRIHALLPRDRDRVNAYLEGFPNRYLQTRTPEVVRTHVLMASRLDADANALELDFRYAPGVSELTLITRDRPMLFASVAGALAGWGMNIITADAFSNAQGVVVDSFRFTDTFRTLELNESERDRFVASVRDVIAGRTDLEALLASRRRGRRTAAKMRVATRVEFDDLASSHSTVLQVVAQDTPGLLRALSLTLAEQSFNIEVALVDTEGETAIDVFYVTYEGDQGREKLSAAQQEILRSALLGAIDRNAA